MFLSDGGPPGPNVAGLKVTCASTLFFHGPASFFLLTDSLNTKNVFSWRLPVWMVNVHVISVVGYILQTVFIGGHFSRLPWDSQFYHIKRTYGRFSYLLATSTLTSRSWERSTRRLLRGRFVLFLIATTHEQFVFDWNCTAAPGEVSDAFSVAFVNYNFTNTAHRYGRETASGISFKWIVPLVNLIFIRLFICVIKLHVGLFAMWIILINGIVNWTAWLTAGSA